jgi:hypothetical protein
VQVLAVRRGVGLAHDHGALIAKPSDRLGVTCGDVVAQFFGAAGGTQSDGFEGVFDRERQSVDVADGLAPRTAVV